MIPFAEPVFPIGPDAMAMAYRAFDHWLKHEHTSCQHDSVLDCVEEYGRVNHL